MPLYEYECQREDRRFEVIQKFSDDPLTQCPECGGEVRKLLSAPAVHFKGAGWYVTDYGKGGEKPKTDSDSGKKETKADSGDSSDSKPSGEKASKTEKKESKSETVASKS